MSFFWVATSVIISSAVTGIVSTQQTKATKSATRLAQQRHDQALATAQAEKDSADERARASSKRRKVGMKRSETVKTSPLGIAGQAEIAQKTLLGQ